MSHPHCGVMSSTPIGDGPDVSDDLQAAERAPDLDPQLLRAVVDAFEDAAALIGAESDIVLTNRAWRVHGFADPVFADGDPVPVARVVDGEVDHFAAVSRRERADGWRWYRSRVRAVNDIGGVTAILTHRDITDERRLHSRMATSPVAHLELERDGSLLNVNERWEELRGRPVGAELGRRWLRDSPKDQSAELLERLETPEPFQFILTTVGHDDRGLVVTLDLDPIFDGEEWIGWQGSATDRTEMRDLEEVAGQAYVDPLTGLGNRSLFETTTSRALSRRDASTCAVLFVDLDGFKAVNDRFGHAAGDDVLCMVTERITAAIRPADLVTRYGGDEFAVLLEDVQAPFIQEVAARIVEAFRPPFHLGTDVVRVGVSVGVADCAPGDDVDTVVARADRAMYQAKRGGGMGVTTADPTND